MAAPIKENQLGYLHEIGVDNWDIEDEEITDNFIEAIPDGSYSGVTVTKTQYAFVPGVLEDAREFRLYASSFGKFFKAFFNGLKVDRDYTRALNPLRIMNSLTGHNTNPQRALRDLNAAAKRNGEFRFVVSRNLERIAFIHCTAGGHTMRNYMAGRVITYIFTFGQV